MRGATPKKNPMMLWFIIAAAILLAGVVVVPDILSPERRASRWVSHWSEQFHRCHSLRDIHSLPKSERPDLIITKTFSDGAWVAVVSEHDCTDGAGFDAAVFYDSRGTI